MKTGEAEDGQAVTVRRRTGGRSARVTEAVLRATLEALVEQGFSSLTFTEIGQRAGVHGTSIQRRWGSRENLLLEALLLYGSDAIQVRDTGSLRGDLVSLAQALAAYFASPVGQSIMQVLVTPAGDDLAFAANRDAFLQKRFGAMRSVFQRAATRGELRPGIDHEIALELALGPLYVRTLVTHGPIDEPFIEAVIDALLAGLSAQTSVG